MDFKKFAKQDNACTNPITGVAVASRSPTADRHARVELRETGSIDVYANGPEAELLKLCAQIDGVIAGCSPWYAPLAKINGHPVLLVLYLIVFSLFSMGLASGAISEIPTWVFIIVPPTMMFSAIPLGSLLNRLRARVFPTAVFAIGDGIKRHATMEIWRVGVVLAFAINVLAGLVVAIVLAV